MKRFTAYLAIASMLVTGLTANSIFDWTPVSAHPGEVLGPAWAETAPIIDGNIEAVEWGNADTARYRTTGGIEGSFYVMNDAKNLYIALTTTDSTLSENSVGTDSVGLYFDNNNDGEGPELGDDIYGWTGYHHEHFVDGFSTGTYSLNRDGDYGGTSDGAAAAVNIKRMWNSFEIAHPLDSRDDAHDFSLPLGDIVGFALRLTVDGVDEGWWPSSNLAVWHDIVIATSGRILIDEAHTNRGPASSSLFDEAEAFLESYGHQVEYHLDGPITSAVLEGFDVLLIAAPFSSYTSSEISVIHSFVSSGHGAFLIGEYSPWWEYPTYMNDISTTFGIRFESNLIRDPTNYQDLTSMPIIHVLDQVHPMTKGVASFQIFGGCSLSLESPSLPLAWGDDDTYTVPSSTPPIVLLAASYYGTGRVLGFADANAFDNIDSDNDGTHNLYDEDNEWLLLKIITWLIVPANNLSVDKIVPIQVIWENKAVSGEAEALIKDKKTALYVAVSSTFATTKWAEIEIAYNFGSIFVEEGPYGTGVPIRQGLNEFYLPGGPRQYPWYGAWVSADNPPWLYWTSTGVDNITAKVDPYNKIAESKELDNTGVTNKKVADASEFKVLYLPVYFPDWGESSFTPDANWIERSNEFLVATYPIAESEFTYTVTAALAASSPQHNLNWLYDNVANPWSILASFFGWDRLVVIVQNLGQFDPGLLGIAIGVLRTPENRVPVVVQHLGDDDLIAHEIGHTMYLWHPHDIGTPVYEGQRYSVAKRDYEDWCNTFMSYRVAPWWIDKHRYDTDPKTWIDLSAYGYTGTWQWNLYDQFKQGPYLHAILIRGYINREGIVIAPDPWYYIPEGIPDLEPDTKGDYYIVLKNVLTDTLARFGFNVLFSYLVHGDYEYDGGFKKMETDLIHFSFKVPYIEGTAVIQIQDSQSNVLYSRRVSANSPEVAVTYPNGGEFLKLGEIHKLTWKADDLDADKLSYAVSYSNDGGENWTPVAITLEEPTFPWNTEDLHPGRYLIKVIASDGFNTGEDVSDRCFMVAWILGDVDADRDVDFDDIVAIAMAYRSKPGYPNWNPLADLDCDNDVDFDDVVTAAMNYMKTDC